MPANRRSAPGRKWRPCSGDEENFIRVGALDLGAGGKSTHIDITGVRSMRTCHEARLSRNRSAVGNISRGSCGNSCLWSRTGRRVLRRPFRRRTWGRGRWSVSKLGLRARASLIAEPVLTAGSVGTAFAPTFAGCERNQECCGGHNPVRRFHSDDPLKTHDWRPTCNANLVLSSGARLRFGSWNLEERCSGGGCEHYGLIHGNRAA